MSRREFCGSNGVLGHVEFGRVGVAAGENSAACFQDLSAWQQSGELMLAHGGHIAGRNPGSGARIVEFGAALDIAARRAAKILRALSARDQNLVIGKLRPAVAEASHAHAASQGPCARCRVIQLGGVGIEPPAISATGHKDHAVCRQERGDVLRAGNIHGSGQSPGSRFGIKQFRAGDALALMYWLPPATKTFPLESTVAVAP